MNNHIDVLKNYFPLVLTSLCVALGLRVVELALIVSNYSFSMSLFSSEIVGFLYDLLLMNVFLMAFYFPFYFISKRSEAVAYSFFLVVISVGAVVHFLLLNYYVYQLIPLDVFIYTYSIDEILFTINTSGVNRGLVFISVFSLLIFVLLCFLFFKKYDFPKLVLRIVYATVLLSLPVFLCCSLLKLAVSNQYVVNKSTSFYAKSIAYFMREATDFQPYSLPEVHTFQQLYSSKKFISEEYPLLHETDTLNPWGHCFERFDTPPTIVLLIVEGLNDEYVHPYQGVLMMPFLNKLKEQSLYWNTCFTLGERSFAAVPSLLGGLPYGKEGFTLEEKLPRHLSLVSILGANSYFTTFFYGQGAWFHQKDRFFNYNNVGLIVDNSKFSDKYPKIIVSGETDYFWGYNDKHLFSQSLDVIDTLPPTPRLDVYFTGTMHSPFIIDDEEVYSKRLDELKTKSNQQFFATYSKYLKSILFTDDALSDYFVRYQKRKDFDNTIFIITGDHPMTELPRKNSLKRYHVPFIVYSSKLKRPAISTNVVSHLDFPETLLSFLKPYLKHIPTVSASLGEKMAVIPIVTEKRVAFMDDNRDVIDYYSNGYYVSGSKTYKVNTGLELTEINDKTISEKLQNELALFEKTSLYVTSENKIISDSLYYKVLNYTLLCRTAKKDTVKMNGEYMDIIPNSTVENKDLLVDVSFSYQSQSEKLSLIVQLSDVNGKAVVWENTAIDNRQHFFQTQLIIPRQEEGGGKYFFKAYFWKNDDLPVEFSAINAQVHYR